MNKSARYIKAPQQTLDQVKAVIEEHCDELSAVGVTFDVLMAYAPENEQGEKTGPALKHHGYPCNGLASIVSLKNRVCGRADGEIILDGDRWLELTDGQQKALIHHELFHFIVARDVEGSVIVDSCKRPKLKMRLHDVEVGWFNHVARAHGQDSAEITQARQIVLETGEIYFPFHASATGRKPRKTLAAQSELPASNTPAST